MVLIKEAEVVPGLTGWLLIEFDNGIRKLVDINPQMEGVLQKLKDQEFFEQVYVDPELHTISWPGELDLDPDNLYIEGISIKVAHNLAKAIKTKTIFADFIEQL
ncbi:DUF2442 domain-containing protein [Bacillus sp. REN16]|uniref:DUF2442 domain-containing protein n=1 Tax=Bacillus sp. REN16 TaxID=2887296 RepID=UPI001E616564|nr:DUF2442 domain-containing protein [Bacillus sp. REN16]MCC3359165.1 DUF2442 domain-containing protein [Bacillus sp. REN16]